MRSICTLVVAILMVAISVSVSSANIYDSVRVTFNNGDTATVVATQDVVDSLYVVGEDDAANNVLLHIIGAERKAEVMAKKQAEAEKKFWTEVDSVRSEIPKSLDSMIAWIDTPAKGVASLLRYGVSKRSVDVNASVDEFKSLVREAAMMMAMIHRHTVELNGPARRKLEKQDSLLIEQMETNVDFLAQTAVQVEENMENINILREHLDETAINALAALQFVDFAKIHSKAKDDARRLRKDLTHQVEDDYEPIELCGD